MNFVFYLFLIKNVLAEELISKQGIDYPYLYQKEFDKTDGIELESNRVEILLKSNLTSDVKNGTDEQFLYLEQAVGTNNINIVNGFNNLDELDINGIDEEDEIERPCKIYDKNCIRRYFAAHSLCTPMYQPIPNPVYRPQTTYYFARINVTVTAVEIYYTGIGGRITEFFINKNTNRLLLAFTFDQIIPSMENAYFRFNRRGSEPIVTRASLRVVYPDVTSTVIIPRLNNLRLDKSEVFVSAGIPGDILLASPSIIGNRDPTVAAALGEFLLRRDVNMQEAFFLDGNYYSYTFIQQTICDFGLILS